MDCTTVHCSWIAIGFGPCLFRKEALEASAEKIKEQAEAAEEKSKLKLEADDKKARCDLTRQGNNTAVPLGITRQPFEQGANRENCAQPIEISFYLILTIDYTELILVPTGWTFGFIPLNTIE